MKKWLIVSVSVILIGILMYTIFSGESSSEAITINPFVVLIFGILLIGLIGWLVYFFIIRRLAFPVISLPAWNWKWVGYLYKIAITILVLVIAFVLFTLDYDKIITEIFRDDDNTTEQPYSAFAGLNTFDFGPMKIKDGESFKLQALLGQAYWPHPKQAGTYIVTIVDMNDVVLCKTKIVKESGKNTQFLPIIPAPGEVEIKMYKITFDRGGDFIVSPNMVL